MTSTTLPVLPLDDVVVLPGMVIPIELSPEARATVDAARAAATDADPQVLIVPRVDGRYGSVGAVADLVQVGRLPSGEPAAVIRAEARAQIGSGVNGPGAALWVEAEILTEPAPTERARALAQEYKQVLVPILQQRNA